MEVLNNRQSLNPRLCTFPSFPIGRSRESLQSVTANPSYSTPRTLPPLPKGPEGEFDLYRRRRNSLLFRPLPVNVSGRNNSVVVEQTTTTPSPKSQYFPPPLATTTKSKHKRVFSSSKPQPLRLVQETLKDKRKRQPPVFYAQHSRSVLQSLTHITIQQQEKISSDNEIMASSNPTMPKVSPPVTLPPLPSSGPRPPTTAPSFGAGGMNPSKDELIADLRRQVNFSFPSFPFTHLVPIPIWMVNVII